jgi:hypothetical protein
MLLTKRASILFDQDLWNLLVATAAKQKISVGDLVRTTMRKVHKDAVEIDQRKQVYEAILAIRKKQKGKVDYKALINYGRKYVS